MEEETLRSRKGDTWDSEATLARRGEGALNRADLGWGRGGGVIISVEDIAPLWGGPSADLAPRSSSPRSQPLPALADPTTCCTRSALCVRLEFFFKKTQTNTKAKK